MSPDGVIAISMTILSAALGFVWRHLEGRFKVAQDAAAAAHEKADRLKDDLATLRLQLAHNLVNREQLDRLFDEKLEPLIHAVNAITDWIERQNGVPTLRGRIPTGG